MRNQPPQPTLDVHWKGGTRSFPAHYERGRFGYRLVPDGEEGIDFAETIDGQWYAYEMVRG